MEKDILILRRRNLGKGSTSGIKKFSKYSDRMRILISDLVKDYPENAKLLIRWGCIAVAPKVNTLNKATSIKNNSFKGVVRTLLKKNKVSVPTIYDVSVALEAFPVVVRPTHHAQGRDLYLCNDVDEFAMAIDKIERSGRNYYISEYIDKDREFGIFVFGGRVTNVIEKVAKNDNAKEDIAWNVAKGNYKFVNVRWDNWPIKACIEAIKATKIVGLDFCRVDIMMKEDKVFFELLYL